MTATVHKSAVLTTMCCLCNLLLLLLPLLSSGVDVQLDVREHSPRGSTIGSLRDNLPIGVSHQSSGQLKFVKMNSNQSQFFTVDSLTGLVKVTKTIDREILCASPAVALCLLEFSVNCLFQKNIEAIVKVRVVVRDINDNACQFTPSATQSVVWREDLRVGETSEFINRPRDPDVDHGIQQSSIRLAAASSNNFRLKIRSTGSLETPFTLELQLARELDYETATTHSVLVEASDGLQKHQCWLNVTVNVEDVNDNSPVFVHSLYSVSVPENFPVNSSIIQLSATDKDSGRNAEIAYSLDPYSDESIRERFQVDRVSGRVLVRRPLSHFEASQYLLNVEARNTGQWRSRLGSAKLQINVTDVNDEAPLVSVYSSTTGNGNLSITENERSEKEVATVSVVDRDSGINAKIVCRLINESSSSIGSSGEVTVSTDVTGLANGGCLELRQTQLEKTFMIVVVRTLDREKTDYINAVLVCSDLGQPALTTFEPIRIQVIDENDNKPKFENRVWELEVSEDTDPSREAVKYRVHQFRARDLDAGQNARIKYSLSSHDPNVAEMLSVHSDTGLLVSKGNLDRENTEQLLFRVIASDNGDPSRQVEREFRLRIADYNDHTPRFGRVSKYLCRVRENLPVDVLVETLLATDADAGLNGELEFEIESAEPVPFSLQVEPNRLYNRITWDTEYKYRIQLRTTSTLDRESIVALNQVYPKYNFIVKAQDKGSFRRFARISIEIDVLDENDEAPIFDVPTKNISMIQLSYYESVNFRFGKIGAYDRDEGPNATVQYNIDRGDPEMKFYLDPKTGELRLAKKLSSADARIYHVVVVARDMGTPPRSSSVTINIKVDSSPPIGHQFDPHSPNMEALNLYIIVAIVIASFVISVILLVAICVVLQKSRGSSNQQGVNHTIKSINDNCSPIRDGYGMVGSGGGGGDYSIMNLHARPSPLTRHASIGMLPLGDGMTMSLDQQQQQLQGLPHSPDHFLTANKTAIGLANEHFRAASTLPYQTSFNTEENFNSNDKDSGKGDSVDARMIYQQQHHQGDILNQYHPVYSHFSTSTAVTTNGHSHQLVSDNTALAMNRGTSSGHYNSRHHLKHSSMLSSTNDLSTLRRPLLSFGKSVDGPVSNGCVGEPPADLLRAINPSTDCSSVICNVNNGSFV